MPRLPETLKQARSNAVHQFFLQHPDASIRAANEVIQEEFGQAMRFSLITKIRAEVRAELRGTTSALRPEKNTAVTAARPADTAVNANGMALIRGTPSELEFLKAVVQLLNSNGVAELKVDHHSQAYLVVSKT